MTTISIEQPADIVERTSRPVKLRLYVMMFLQYFIQGCYLPIISLYLQESLGFGSSQLGNFGAALAIGPLVAPFILGQLVDRHLATQHVLSVCHFAGGAIMLALYYQTQYLPVLVLGTLYSIMYVPSLMLTNSLTFHHLVQRDREFPMVRLWGTIGFVFPAWLVEFWWLRGLTGEELVQARGITLVFAALGGFLMGVYALTLPHTPPPSKDARDFAPKKVIGLLQHRDFLVLVLVSFGIAIVHNYFFVWNSPFLKQVLANGSVGGAWEQRISSIGQVAEVLVMAGLGAALVRFGFRRIMLLGITAYMTRFVVLSVVGMFVFPFGLNMALTCIGQALHGFCFGCFLAVAYMYVDRVAPIDVRGSMQNVYGTFVIGVGFFLGGIVSGQVGKLFTDPEGARNWSLIWGAGAIMTAACLFAFAAWFPKDRSPAEAAST